MPRDVKPLTIDITSKNIICKSKSRGTSAGKVCQINGDTYYLKAIQDDNSICCSLKGLQAIYNLRFAGEVIGVRCRISF